MTGGLGPVRGREASRDAPYQLNRPRVRVEKTAPRCRIHPSSNVFLVMSDAEAQVLSYLRAWNERDAERRRAWVARTWTEDGTYTDPEGGGTGHAGIDALILQTQRQRPRCRLRLVGPVAARGDCV